MFFVRCVEQMKRRYTGPNMFLWNHLSRENGENVAQEDFIVNNGESEGVINIQA